jgi:hypothetical protein
MILDTLYALCNLGFLYCSWNAGRCARALIEEGHYLLPLLVMGAFIWLAWGA